MIQLLKVNKLLFPFKRMNTDFSSFTLHIISKNNQTFKETIIIKQERNLFRKEHRNVKIKL